MLSISIETVGTIRLKLVQVTPWLPKLDYIGQAQKIENLMKKNSNTRKIYWKSENIIL